MKQHFSLDIETLDTKDTAVVLSVGACVFDEERIGAAFHISFLIEEQIQVGRTISTDTFHWWAKQLAENMADTPFPVDPVTVWGGLAAFNRFFEYNSVGYRRDDGTTPVSKDIVVWCRGPQFDWAILNQLYNLAKFNSPVKFQNVRDQRTFCKQASAPIAASETVLHNACSDAKSQARHIQHVLKKCKLKLL